MTNSSTATAPVLSAALKEVEYLCNTLFAASRCNISDIPKTQGVYLIYNTKDEIMYVGKGKNLKRRICDDHRGGDEKISTSTFRRSVHKLYGIAAGKPLQEWVCDNCSFAILPVSDPDLCAAVEAVTILVLRRQGCKLLNA